VTNEPTRSLRKENQGQNQAKKHAKQRKEEKMRRTLITAVLLAGLAWPAMAQVEKGGTVNVNTATVQELQLLPRVGPALAQRILEFREKNGPFKSPEELMRVKGIGEKSFALLKPYVTTSGPTTLKEKVKAASRRPKKAEAKAGGQ
jgi:competence protein ComEA